jgi:hypothetical protein
MAISRRVKPGRADRQPSSGRPNPRPLPFREGEYEERAFWFPFPKGKGLGVRSAIKTCALLLAAVDVGVLALATFDTIRAE